MVLRTVVLSSLASFTLAARFKRATLHKNEVTRTPSATVRAASSEVDCSSLVNITVRDIDFTQVVQLTCNNWPASMGAFPASDIQSLQDLLAPVFDTGGMWDKFNEDRASEPRNKAYCHRAQVSRQEKTYDRSSCPSIVNDTVRAELLSLPEGEKNTKFEAGSWACDDSVDKCACLQRDDLNDIKEPVDIASRPDDCDMVHQNRCYGECPRGHKPVWIVGYFRPVCNSICAETEHPFRCGLGCARSRQDCQEVLADQTKSVLLSLSKVASIVTGNTQLHSLTEAVLGVTEFTSETLGKVADAAFKVWTDVKREGAQLGLAVTLGQYLKDVATDLVGDWEQLSGLLESSLSLLLDVFDTQYGWSHLDVNWLSNVLSKHGNDVIEDAHRLVSAFTHDACQVAQKDDVFTIEQSGDERMIGPWYKSGQNDGRDRFVPKLNSDVVLEWGARRRAWNLWVKDKKSWQGWWLGWMGLGWRTLYENRQNSPSFPTAGWILTEGAWPPPFLLSVDDDGTAIEV